MEEEISRPKPEIKALKVEAFMMTDSIETFTQNEAKKPEIRNNGSQTEEPFPEKEN